jgi:hypothetical protein
MLNSTNPTNGQIAAGSGSAPPKTPILSNQRPLHPKGEPALRLARADIPVFPLPIDDPQKSVEELKRPFLKWQEAATTDEAQIRKWWSDKNFNIGIALPQDIVVIDYDVGDKKLIQDQAIALFSEHFGELPKGATPVVGTQGGGMHTIAARPPEKASQTVSRALLSTWT